MRPLALCLRLRRVRRNWGEGHLGAQVSCDVSNQALYSKLFCVTTLCGQVTVRFAGSVRNSEQLWGTCLTPRDCRTLGGPAISMPCSRWQADLGISTFCII